MPKLTKRVVEAMPPNKSIWDSDLKGFGARRKQGASISYILITISIQGHGPMFKELRDRADQPEVYFQLHVADDGAAIDDEQQWHRANAAICQA